VRTVRSASSPAEAVEQLAGEKHSYAHLSGELAKTGAFRRAGAGGTSSSGDGVDISGQIRKLVEQKKRHSQRRNRCLNLSFGTASLETAV
jgi:hypothetical protein